MMVNLARDLRGMIRDQESGAFDHKKQYQHEICGSTLGFWGYGGSARETARLAKNMGIKVHALEYNGVGKREHAYVVPGKGDPEGLLPDRVFGLDETETFLSGLDFLIIAMPLTKNTEGIVGEAELKALPDHAYVLNPARGPIIQEKAMLRALQEGWIAGAALDTHWCYPLPEDHPIRFLKNVIITPHISGSSKSPHFIERMWDIFITNLGLYLNGDVLMNELTSKQLDGS
jgi:phosphoglycerate dehydrogenase-like enzyme